MVMTYLTKINHRLAAAALVATSVLGLMARPASASTIPPPTFCTPHALINNSAFVYDMCSMPDVDQRRAALPGSGAWYCAPTASLNALLWLDQHGYPNILTGNYDAYDGTAGTYAALDQKLLRLGQTMGTATPGGTTGTGELNGITQLLIEKGYWDIPGVPTAGTLSIQWVDFRGSYDPVRALAQLGANPSGNNLVLPTFGSYDANWKRTGGHLVTLIKAQGTGVPDGSGTRSITYSDPADDSALYSQSAYTPVTHNVAPVTILATGFLAQVGTGNAYLEGAFVINRSGSAPSSPTGLDRSFG
jgi:hypothetical protein